MRPKWLMLLRKNIFYYGMAAIGISPIEKVAVNSEAIYSKKHRGFIFSLLIDVQEHNKKRMEEQHNEKKSYHD